MNEEKTLTITHFRRNAMLFGIAVLIALSLLLALTFAVPHSTPSFGVSHTSAPLVSHGRMLAGGGFPAPPFCPPDTTCPNN